MNQKSIELLSSEELEIVTGGGEFEDFLVGLLDPFLNFVPTTKSGKFDTAALGKSLGQVTSSTLLTASLAATLIYGTYKLTGVLRSKFGKEAEGEPQKKVG